MLSQIALSISYSYVIDNLYGVNVVLFLPTHLSFSYSYVINNLFSVNIVLFLPTHCVTCEK